jgi:cytochrome c
MRRYSFLLLLAASVPFAAAVWAKAPQAAAASAGYSYTVAQAQLGKAVYAAHCAVCHGDKMEGKEDGMDDAPPLVGARFDTHWRARPQALYTKIKLSMPQDDPGILSKDEAADIVATILRANKVASAP